MDKPRKDPPAYRITSVDHALRIAAMLQLEGALSVSEIAERLSVARSTAHRLLSMLVYRDFAVQGDDRRYLPGAAMSLPGHRETATAQLRKLALPHLTRLAEAVGETVHLAVRIGRSVRLPVDVESERSGGVPSRQAMVFPAHLAATGLISLADLDDEQLDELYAEVPSDSELRPDMRVLRAELAAVRRNGFGLNDQRTEWGTVVVSVGVRVAGRVVAGIGVGMPHTRYDRRALPELLRAMRATAADLESELPPDLAAQLLP